MQTPKAQFPGGSTPDFVPPDMSTLQSALAAFSPADAEVVPPHFLPDPQGSRQQSHASAGIPLDRWSQKAAPGLENRLENGQALQDRLDQETGVGLREGQVGRIPRPMSLTSPIPSRPGSSTVRPPKMPATSSSRSPRRHGSERQTRPLRPPSGLDRDTAAAMTLMSPEACKTCGNIFMPDAIHCRKCGMNRREEEAMTASGRLLETLMASARSESVAASQATSGRLLEQMMAGSPHGSGQSSWATGNLQEKYDNWDSPAGGRSPTHRSVGGRSSQGSPSQRSASPLRSPAPLPVRSVNVLPMQLQTMSDWSQAAGMQATATIEAAVESRPASSVYTNEGPGRLMTAQSNWQHPAPIAELTPPVPPPLPPAIAELTRPLPPRTPPRSATTAWSETDVVNELPTQTLEVPRPPSTLSAARSAEEERALMAASQSSWISRPPPTSPQSQDLALVTDCSLWRDRPAGQPIGSRVGNGSEVASSRSPDLTMQTTQQDQEWVSPERRAAVEASLWGNQPATADGVTSNELTRYAAEVEARVWESPQDRSDLDSEDIDCHSEAAWSESPELNAYANEPERDEWFTEWLNEDKQAEVEDAVWETQRPAVALDRTLEIPSDLSATQRLSPAKQPNLLSRLEGSPDSQESFGHFEMRDQGSSFGQDPTSPTCIGMESFDGSPSPTRPSPHRPSPLRQGLSFLPQVLEQQLRPRVSRTPSPQEPDDPFGSPNMRNPYNMHLMPVRIPPLPEPLLLPRTHLEPQPSGFTQAQPSGFTSLDTAEKMRRIIGDSRSASPTEGQAATHWEELNKMKPAVATQPVGYPQPGNRPPNFVTNKMAPLRAHPAIPVDVEAGNLFTDLPPLNADVPMDGIPGLLNLPVIADTAASHGWGMSPLLDLPMESIAPADGEHSARSWFQGGEDDIWD